MLNASNAVENQKVSICRLSGENRSLIIKALDIAASQARMAGLKSTTGKSGIEFIELANELDKLEVQLKGSKEVWLIES